MAENGNTDMGERWSSFPTTHWSMLAAVRGEMTEAHKAVLNVLIHRYWKPVYWFVRRRGYDNDDAEDAVQEFFTSWLARELFGRADPSRGRFRSFLRTSVSRFLMNDRRAKHAKRRRPPAGIVSLNAIMAEDGLTFEPGTDESPEATYDRIWAMDLIQRAMLALQREYRNDGKADEYEFFRRRIVEPALTGAAAPPLSEMAERLGLTEKQASSRLITARRAYQRLLREEISLFACSPEDVAAEIRDLFVFLGRA